MKKLVFFLSLLFCLSNSGFGINGNGSYPLPYNGPLTSNMTWVGKVYVNGDVTVNGFTLTIMPGTTIVFLAAGSDIIITGTGILNASGGAGSNIIRFTADNNNNSIYGEAGERWGHISFQNMNPGFASPSIINYCIIEYGQKGTDVFGFETTGGGIQTSYSYLTISNSIIRNNYAGFGGGICVSSNSSPYISNCIISNNTAERTGGGILIYQVVSIRLDNCIIMKNTSLGQGGGGGVFVGSSNDVRFYNCDIVSNVSTQGYGNSIRLDGNLGSIRPAFYNTIVWGSNNSIYYSYVQRPAPNDLINCAIQGYTSGYTNCINLNAVNTDPSGPNFLNVTSGSENYQITGNSPCRDTGTNSGAPTTDFLGRTRVLPFDIGSYEYMSSRWKLTATSSDWSNASNWDGGVPSGGSDVVIPSGAANYPVNTPAPDFTIETGSIMTIGPGAQTTLGNFVNNGTLILQSDAISGDASFIVGSYSGNNATVELFLTGGEAGGSGSKTFRWHYISTPVSSLAVSTFSPTYTLDLARWYDDRVSGTLISGWVAYDGYVYATGGTDGARQFSTLQPGLGYDYYDNADDKYTFAGQLNTSDVTMSLSYAAADALHGFNLLGNPFSCGLDWSQIIADPSYPLNTSKGLYFTRNNVQCSYVGGVGIPGDVTGIIPPMQGFFLKTNSAGNSIKIPASARVQGSIHPRYKGVNTIPLLRLAITENNGNDETVVRFDNQAKSELDYDFDMVKMFISTTNTQIYSSYGGTNYSINGLPFPDSTLSIPIVVNFLTTGTHTINATQLQYLDNYTVTLTDKSTGFVADLKTTPVLTFTANAGTIADRFVLKFTNISTGVDNPVITNGKFNIYPAFGFINIQTLADEWDGKDGSVNVLDLSGKIVGSLTNVTFSRNSLISVQANLEKGLYIVELKSGIKRYVGKVVVR